MVDAIAQLQAHAGRRGARQAASPVIGTRRDVAERGDAKALGVHVHARRAHESPVLANAGVGPALDHVRLEEAPPALGPVVGVAIEEILELAALAGTEQLGPCDVGGLHTAPVLEQVLQVFAL